MISKIICLIVIVIVLVIVVSSNKTKELFNTDKSDKIFSRVDPNHPKCFAKCILENGATLDFCKKIFTWNEDNIHDGYCHTANDKKFPFVCTEKECTTNCGKLDNSIKQLKDLVDAKIVKNKPKYKNGKKSLLHINPIKDYSRCVNTKYGCVEHTLNQLSQGCSLYTAGCRECIKNYYDNINTLWNNSVESAINLNETCPTKNNSP